MDRVYLTNDSWYIHIEDFLKIDKDQFETLWKLQEDVSHYYIKMFGKTYQLPRKQALYSEYDISYKFSGMNVESNEIPNILKSILKDINVDYNAIFVNWYKNGSEYISAHSDDEKDIIENKEITSLSFGETRTFRIRSKDNKNNRMDFELKHGSLFIMGGKFQKEFTHEVPKTKKNNERRINLTLRNMKIL